MPPFGSTILQTATEPPPGTKRPSGDLKVVGRLLPYLWPKGDLELRARVVAAMLCLLLAKLATVAIPVLYGRAVDALTKADSNIALALPLGLVLAYGLARVLSLVFAELRNAVFQKVAQRAIRRVALEVFRHLHALSLRFHLDRQTGGLTRAIERGTQAITSLLSFALFNIVPTAFELILAAGVLWGLFGVWYAVATVATVGLYVLYTYRVTNWRLGLRRSMNESDQKANTKAIDSLLNYETVKYFTNEEHEARRYDDALRAYEGAATKSAVSLSMLNIGQAAIISIGLTIIMLMAARDILAHRMSVGDFVLANTYLLQLAQPLGVFGFVYGSLKQGLVDMESMFDLLDVGAEVADTQDAKPLVAAGGALEFADVRFGYDTRRPILKGISFKVPAGRSLAIVGQTGAGKSTISRLLFRFYDVDSGAIRIDGQDIRQVTQTSLRQAIGIVPQDTVLFNDTIAYNIGYGRPEATQDAIEHAARLANVHAFVMRLPDGYKTLVGERGLKLSGGEKQRVAIARALLKNPAIMLFDEATSALDTATEREIQANLREASRGRTTLVIAHRLSTVVDADEILVLDQGEVVERGRFAELVSAGGPFAEMWQRQQEGLEAEGEAVAA